MTYLLLFVRTANWFVDDERDDWAKTMQLILGSSFYIYVDRNDSMAMIDAFTHFADIATRIEEDENSQDEENDEGMPG